MQLNVLYGCDDNYAPYTGVSLLSLFENNKDIEEITIYLAAMNFSEVKTHPKATAGNVARGFICPKAE